MAVQPVSVYIVNFLRALFFIMSLTTYSWAAGSCSNGVANQMGGDYNFTPVSITLGSNMATNTVIYTNTKNSARRMQASCPGLSSGSTAMTLTDIPPGTKYTVGSDIIYPTNVKGIGMSIMGNDSYTPQVPAWPATAITQSGGPGGGIDDWVTIKLWKTADNLELQNGQTIIGPTLIMGIIATNGATFNAGPNVMSSTFWAATSRRITTGLNVYSPTCDFSTGNKTVLMGTVSHDPSKDFHPWNDASFKLNCPNPSGYGGGAANAKDIGASVTTSGSRTGNNIKNQTMMIKVVPRTAIITQDAWGKALAGTIDLNGTGARGYGIQLAWGDAATLAATQPAKPVVFNSFIPINQVNSSFTLGPYNFSTVMPKSDIKLAARFARLSNDIEPGLAEASVEVIANYN